MSLRTILAVDYGAVRIGLAVSDPSGVVATGAGVFANGADALAAIRRRIEERGVAGIIVGLPLTLQGGVGDAAVRALAFADELRAMTGLPVETRDERFTSVIAEKTIRELGVGKKQRRRKDKVDEMAAVLILQEYLRSASMQGWSQ